MINSEFLNLVSVWGFYGDGCCSLTLSYQDPQANRILDLPFYGSDIRLDIDYDENGTIYRIKLSYSDGFRRHFSLNHFFDADDCALFKVLPIIFGLDDVV